MLHRDAEFHWDGEAYTERFDTMPMALQDLSGAQILPGLSGMWPTDANRAKCEGGEGGYAQVYTCDGLQEYLNTLDDDAFGVCASTQGHWLERCCREAPSGSEPGSGSESDGESDGEAPSSGEERGSGACVLEATKVIAINVNPPFGDKSQGNNV